MKKNFIIYLMLAGLISIFTGCKKDETRATMLDTPVIPVLKTLPDLTLSRAHGSDTLTFTGKPVDPGFNASATYFLEACIHGTNFADPLVVWTGVQDTSIKMVESDLNVILLRKFPADQVTSVDFRIRSVLVVDAGTYAPGTITQPFLYNSLVSTADVHPYGFPRLDLINSGTEQKIESLLANSMYAGYVLLKSANPFTVLESETGTTFGTSGGALLANGTPFSVASNGWYRFTANTIDLTYKLDLFNVGLVGNATPNGWNAPDSKMLYNPLTGTWDITLDLVAGDIKFRLNDDWAWNLGGTPGNLTHNGSNYTVTPGNYTISLTVTVPLPAGSEAGTFTITKNSR
jgi:hypothetical protein